MILASSLSSRLLVFGRRPMIRRAIPGSSAYAPAGERRLRRSLKVRATYDLLQENPTGTDGEGKGRESLIARHPAPHVGSALAVRPSRGAYDRSCEETSALLLANETKVRLYTQDQGPSPPDDSLCTRSRSALRHKAGRGIAGNSKPVVRLCNQTC